MINHGGRGTDGRNALLKEIVFFWFSTFSPGRKLKRPGAFQGFRAFLFHVPEGGAVRPASSKDEIVGEHLGDACDLDLEVGASVAIDIARKHAGREAKLACLVVEG